MTTAFLSDNDPAKGIIDYVSHIKPYHTKILDVVIDYEYTSSLCVCLEERHESELVIQYGDNSDTPTTAPLGCDGFGSTPWGGTDDADVFNGDGQLALKASTTLVVDMLVKARYNAHPIATTNKLLIHNTDVFSAQDVSDLQRFMLIMSEPVSSQVSNVAYVPVWCDVIGQVSLACFLDSAKTIPLVFDETADTHSITLIPLTTSNKIAVVDNSQHPYSVGDAVILRQHIDHSIWETPSTSIDHQTPTVGMYATITGVDYSSVPHTTSGCAPVNLVTLWLDQEIEGLLPPGINVCSTHGNTFVTRLGIYGGGVCSLLCPPEQTTSSTISGAMTVHMCGTTDSAIQQQYSSVTDIYTDQTNDWVIGPAPLIQDGMLYVTNPIASQTEYTVYEGDVIITSIFDSLSVSTSSTLSFNNVEFTPTTTNTLTVDVASSVVITYNYFDTNSSSKTVQLTAPRSNNNIMVVRHRSKDTLVTLMSDATSQTVRITDALKPTVGGTQTQLDITNTTGSPTTIGFKYLSYTQEG